jgi:competence protein ComGC
MPKNTRYGISAATLVGCVCVLIAGCSKKTETSPTGAPGNTELAGLTQQVRRYSFEKHKLPQSLDELVTAGYLKAVPQAPAGKKYAIDASRAEVILLNQ